MSSWCFTVLLCRAFLLRLAWHSTLCLFTWGTLFNLTEFSVNLTNSREKLVISFVCPGHLTIGETIEQNFCRQTHRLSGNIGKTSKGRYICRVKSTIENQIKMLVSLSSSWPVGPKNIRSSQCMIRSILVRHNWHTKEVNLIWLHICAIECTHFGHRDGNVASSPT